MVVELVGIMLEDHRTGLVLADEHEFLRTQGAARLLDKLYRQLTQAPPNKEI